MGPSRDGQEQVADEIRPAAAAPAVKNASPSQAASQLSPVVAQLLKIPASPAPAQNNVGPSPNAEQQLSEEEQLMMAAYEGGANEPIDDDIMNALHEMDFSFDPDAEESDDDDDDGENLGSSPRNIVKTQKKLEVLNDGLKKATLSNESDAIKMRWKTLVENLKQPLSTIMAHAVVSQFNQSVVDIVLSDAFRGMVSKSHEALFTREIRQIFGWNVQLKIAFDENVDEQSSLAAESARRELAVEEEAKQALWNHPLLQAVISSFHLQLEPETVQFTINTDRISNENS